MFKTKKLMKTLKTSLTWKIVFLMQHDMQYLIFKIIKFVQNRISGFMIFFFNFKYNFRNIIIHFKEKITY